MKVSLKAARVNANMTQEQVGTILGVSKDTIKAMESGRRGIKVTEFDSLCEAYGCTRDDIFLPINPTLSEKTERRGD